MREYLEKIGSIILILLIIPLAIATIRIIYQKIFEPEKIPDFFGYKMFVVFSDDMDVSLEYGDLVITYNQNKDEIKENSLVAFRNAKDLVSISSKNPNLDRFEGLVVHIIPKIGYILYLISRPINILAISCIILAIGGVCIYFAKKADEREAEEQDYIDDV